MDLPLLYLPEDYSGVAPSNKRTLEAHSIDQVRDLRLLKPHFSPFFASTLKLYSVALSGARTELTRGVDYKCIEFMPEESVKAGKEICKFILIYNQEVGSNFKVTYNALGGDTFGDLKTIAQIVNSLESSGGIVDWNDIFGKPSKFGPVKLHNHHVLDTYGLDYVLEAQKRVLLALNTYLPVTVSNVPNPNGPGTIVQRTVEVANPADLYLKREIEGFATLLISQLTTYKQQVLAHIRSKGEGHGDSAATIGLGSVENRDIVARTSNGGVIDPYATPKRMKALLAGRPIPSPTEHLASRSNPHKLTKQQVLLGNIENYKVFIGYETTVDGVGSYLFEFESPTETKYIGPYSANKYIEEKSEAHRQTNWVKPLAIYTNSTAGIFKQIEDAILSSEQNVVLIDAAIAAEAESRADAVAPQTSFDLERTEFELLGKNAPFSKVLTSLTQWDYVKKGSRADRVYRLPDKLGGVEFWLDMMVLGNITTTAAYGSRIISVKERGRNRVFNSFGVVNHTYAAQTVDPFAATKSAITLDNLGGTLRQASGPSLRLKTGMSVFVVSKAGPAGTTLPILTARTSTSSGLTSTSLVRHGATRRALDILGGGTFKPITSPNNTSSNDSDSFVAATIGLIKEEHSWLAQATQPSTVTYPRGVAPYVGTTWPASSYRSDIITCIGSDDPSIDQAGSIYEVIIFNRALSRQESLAVLSYLKLKWPTTLTSDYELDFVYDAFHVDRG